MPATRIQFVTPETGGFFAQLTDGQQITDTVAERLRARVVLLVDASDRERVNEHFRDLFWLLVSMATPASKP